MLDERYVQPEWVWKRNVGESERGSQPTAILGDVELVFRKVGLAICVSKAPQRFIHLLQVWSVKSQINV